MRGHRSLNACLFLLLSWVLSACTEVQENSYPSFVAARDAGAISRGWLPQWLPQDTTDITEVHDLDTNRFMARFSFSKNTSPALPSSCKSVVPTSPPAPPFSRRWWPSDVPASGFATHRHAFFQCEGMYVAISSAMGEGYAWNPN